MVSKFICGSDKYELGGINNDVIYTSLIFKKLPEEIKVEGYNLYYPNFFHISLVYIGQLIKKYNITIPDFLNKIVEDFCEFTSTNDIEIVGYKNDGYKLISKGDKKTVVILCEVSNLNKFFDVVNRKYGLNIKYPFPHVTLYNTQKGEPGIYLMDEDDITNFAISIENPIGLTILG